MKSIEKKNCQVGCEDVLHAKAKRDEERVLQLQECQLERDHDEVAQTLNNLANTDSDLHQDPWDVMRDMLSNACRMPATCMVSEGRPLAT